MVSPTQYIKKVNKAVQRGEHNRPIKVVYTKSKPTVGGVKGTASQQTYKKYDKISVYRKLPSTNTERAALIERVKQKYAEAKQKPPSTQELRKNIPLRNQVIRHELWHIHKPYASEKEIRHKLENKPLPNELPPKRRFKK